MKTEKHLSCKPVTATSACAPKVAPFCFHKSKISGKSGERVNQYEKMPGTSPALEGAVNAVFSKQVIQPPVLNSVVVLHGTQKRIGEKNGFTRPAPDVGRGRLIGAGHTRIEEQAP